MRQLQVSVGQDHLLRLIGSPRRGLLELVWNSLDADATEVVITIEQDALGAIQALHVRDNGTGITAEQAERQFDKLGNSWKSVQHTSPAGRPFHGQLGRGRWSAFGIGQQIVWDSTARHVTGDLQRLRIKGSSANLSTFEYEEPSNTDHDAAGTTVTVASVRSHAQKYFQSPQPFIDLTTEFATYVENYAIQITYDKSLIDPSTMQEASYDKVLEVPGAVPSRVELRIIEWQQQVRRALYFVDSNGAILHEMRPGIHAPTFSFTAYVKWGGARAQHQDLLLEDGAPAPVPAIISAAKEALREHFVERDKQQRSKLVTEWKKEATYPYKGEAETSVEAIERELFDVVAITAASSIGPMDRRERQLSFALIQQALSHSPQAVRDVLRDVLNMPERTLLELTTLLERTSLGAIVALAKTVSDRMDFIRALEHLIFEKQNKRKLQERSQLHKILARETWILREEYALSANDETLTSALRSHLPLFAGKDVQMADAQDSEVLDADGKRVIVDLILSSVIPKTSQRREHVVIELKRPSVPINAAGLLQANKYAVAVKNDPRFDKLEVRWEFWIVGDHITDDADNLLDVDGIFASSGKGDNVPIRAVTWAQIIDNAKYRLGFVEHDLQIRPNTASGIAYLQEHYAEYLPADEIDHQSEEDTPPTLTLTSTPVLSTLPPAPEA
jgi:hypothetical protein